MLILLSSIVQAIATLTVGLIVGLIFIWKVGLVGLGKTFYAYQDGVAIDTECLPQHVYLSSSPLAIFVW